MKYIVAVDSKVFHIQDEKDETNGICNSSLWAVHSYRLFTSGRQMPLIVDEVPEGKRLCSLCRRVAYTKRLDLNIDHLTIRSKSVTEPKPTYTTTATIDPAPVTCSSCGATIGEYVTEGRQVWLKIGTVKIRHANGICACGQDWHWTSSDRLLERIVEHRRRNTDRRETE